MSIQILPPQLANQIAAGEVVERPASIVKECVENSIDAGAKQITIAIEQGGCKRILIQDDGQGIAKDQLPLALARHATSKISEIEDLENICSLGFRGEALASISSVSRLTLSSRPADQAEAWLVYAEGQEQAIHFEPVAHPVGTSVDVKDLFFNVPARRKFLKAAKTEFQHIQALIKRIALAHPEIGFTLSHNNKTVLRFAPRNELLKRINDVCGGTFADQALSLDTQYQNYQLRAFVSPPMSGFSDTGMQFIYVNGRMMRDKLIMHALRQAYEGMIAAQQHAGYVVYLSLPSQSFDVNVHPAKHEVRFVESRLVHDFIYQAVNDVLQGGFADAPDYNQAFEPNHEYIQPLQPEQSHSVTSDNAPRSYSGVGYQGQVRPTSQAISNYSELLSSAESSDASATNTTNYLPLTDGRVLIQDKQLVVVSAESVARAFLNSSIANSETSVPLLLPVSIKLNNSIEVHLPETFSCEQVQQKMIIKRVPSLLRQLPWSQVIAYLQDVVMLDHDALAQAFAKSSEALAMMQRWLAGASDDEKRSLFEHATPCRIVSDEEITQ